MKYTIELEQGTMDYVLNTLAEKPYIQVAQVINEISKQIAEQNQNGDN